MKKSLIILVVILLGLAVAAALYLYLSPKEKPHPLEDIVPSEVVPKAPEKSEEEGELSPPIENFQGRVTKKSFGKFVTPGSSPVSPERFTGYHTGTDFETTAEEAGSDVPIFSICKGKVIQRSEVSGYGGLLIQGCTIGGQEVTVLYGHINLSDTPAVGQELERNTKIATLADDNSKFSGFERKHLHLGIHKGQSIEYLGYVDTADKLSGWLNIENYLL